MNFKGKQYDTLDTNLKQLLTVFNSAVKLNNTAADYINGIAVTEVDTAAVLSQHKYDKASTLPNFLEYQNAGINLSLTMPDCPVTKSCLDELTATVADYQNSQYANELRFICYDRKTKQFAISAQGKAALERAVITLTDTEEKIFKAVIDLHQMLVNVNPNYKWQLLSDKIVNNTFNNELRLDDVVYYVKKHGEEMQQR